MIQRREQLRLAPETRETVGISRKSVPVPSSLSIQPGGTMLRLDYSQRAALGETFRELANLVAAGLVIGCLSNYLRYRADRLDCRLPGLVGFSQRAPVARLRGVTI